MLHTLAKYNRRAFWWLALLAIAMTPAAPVSAVESGGVGGRPAYPKAGNPRSESIFIFAVEPGKTSGDGVRINNNTGTTKSIDIYSVDSQASSGGAFACAQKVDEPHAAGSWVELGKTQITLGPQSNEIIPFTLTVPKDTASGEYNGCIVIQEANQTPTAAGNGIALSFRSAIRVAVTVPGDLKKGLFFTGLESRSGEDGKRVVSVSAKNQGNVSLDADIAITLRSVLWTTVRKVGGTFPILANSQSDLNFDTIDPFWGGFYFLRAEASYNPDPGAGIGTGSKTAHVTKRRILFVKPKPLAAVTELLLLTVLVAAAAWSVRRRRFKRQAYRLWTPHRVQPGEHLKTLADSRGIAWQSLARINKIRPPYVLHPGDTIKIPPPKKRPPKTRK